MTGLLAASVDVGSACVPPEATIIRGRSPSPRAGGAERRNTTEVYRGKGGNMVAQSNVAECCRAETPIACFSSTIECRFRSLPGDVAYWPKAADLRGCNKW